MSEIEDFLKKPFLDKLIYALIAVLLFALGLLTKDFPFLSALKALAEKIQPLNMIISLIVLFLLFVLAIVFLSKQSKTIKLLKSEPEFKAHFGAKWLVNLKTGEVSDFPFCGCCEPPKILTTYEDNITQGGQNILRRSYYCNSPNGGGVSYYKFIDQDGKILTHQQAYQKVQEIYQKPK